MKKVLLASILVSLFSSVSFASKCTPSSYQYRVELIGKRTAALAEQMVETLQAANASLRAGSERQEGQVRLFFRLLGTTLTIVNEFGELHHDNYWIKRSINVLKVNCPMYDPKDIDASVNAEIEKVFVPQGMNITISRGDL